MPRKNKLILAGLRKAQLRQASSRDWSNKKATAFLSALGETCNVSEACRQSQIPSSVVYRRRKTDAAFRAGWAEAVGIAYQRLELVLLDRAFCGVEKIITRKDGSEERMLEYSNQLGLTLLKMHRDTAMDAVAEFQPDQIEELKERLFNKLRRLKEREAQEADVAA